MDWRLKKIIFVIIVILFKYGGKTQNKPNILWLVCEDQSLFFSSYYDSIAKTPHLNELSSEGIVYDNFFAVSPVCSPNRSSIITGMYPTTIGTQHMRAYKNNKGSINSKTNLPIYSAVPKRKVQSIFDLTDKETAAMFELLHLQKEDLKNKDTSITGFNIGVNDGEDAGQTIMHCHIHLIPRRSGDMEDPRGGVRGVIPEKQSY